MDGLKVFNWDCEARPFADVYCKALRAEEELRFDGDRRCQQLEKYWSDELDQHKSREIESTAHPAAFTHIEPPAFAENTNLIRPVTLIEKSVKRDSLLGVIVQVHELSESDVELEQ